MIVNKIIDLDPHLRPEHSRPITEPLSMARKPILHYLSNKRFHPWGIAHFSKFFLGFALVVRPICAYVISFTSKISNQPPSCFFYEILLVFEPFRFYYSPYFEDWIIQRFWSVCRRSFVLAQEMFCLETMYWIKEISSIILAPLNPSFITLWTFRIFLFFILW